MNSNERRKIIDNLLDAGNQCLLRFSDRHELASEHDKRVFLLYQCFENFFLHGLRENQNHFNLTRKMISNSLSNSPKNFNHLITKDSSIPNFWQFITFFLNRHEIERFNHLKHIKTSIGRSRAWIRSSLNEHSLERYMKAMLENGCTIVKQFYDEESAIRDLSKQNEILELVSKLNSILFASTIDNPNLNSNFNHHNVQNNYDLIKERKLHQTSLDDQRKLKQKNTQETINQIKVNLTMDQNENEDKTSLNSSHSLTNSSKIDLNLPLSRNSSYSSNYQQDDLDDKSDDNELPINSSILLTPIVAGNFSVVDQFITTNYDEDEKASDFSNQSCNTSCSSTPAFQSKELANFEKTKRLFEKEYESTNQNSSIEINDECSLKQKFKHQREEENLIQKLESQNEQLKNENKQLKSQLKKYIDAISLLPYNDRLAILKFDDLNTDNLLITSNDENNLSEQINEQSSLIKNNFLQSKSKTTNIVNDNTIEESNASSSIELDYKNQIKNDFNRNAYLNYRDSIEYERKLVQVAEMFGEINEYNDRLNRILMQKDATIKVLKDQLIELRGPLPENIQSDEDEIVSIASDSDHQNLQYNSILAQNLCPMIPLINIWIPSAFLADQKQTYQNTYLSADQQRNKKVSSHHVYQIYIRIKDDEWNVYRRYSQFYSIHQILKKKYQQIAELEFPPKKTIGNRHAKVVQERRKKLEAYLRNVLNILQNDSNIYDRGTLIQVLPFLSEKYVVHNKNETSIKNVNRDRDSDLNTGENVVQSQDYIGL